MTAPRHIAVIDIGKTNAKLALVERETLTEIEVVTRPNTVLQGPPWPHFDTEGVWTFLADGLSDLHAAHRVDAISITTHGACAALLARDGSLAAPVLDYECDGPEAARAEYDALRPAFRETGSPRLALGLNLGAQIHWQFGVDPGLRSRLAQLVTWPQYWGHRLTGVAATDVTSLGCHTDLWNPLEGRFSSLVDRLGLAGKIAPPRRPDEILGPILPSVAARTGLDRATPVVCGIHDSNASLLPHLLSRASPFAVVSSGTWTVSMAVGGAMAALDPARDTLINVNARGEPVPSARFMGGREFDNVMGGRPFVANAAALDEVLERGIRLFPSVEPGSGPFPGRRAEWSHAGLGDDQRGAALSLYLAMMTATCLEMIGARGPAIVEGPFAANEAYLHMLSAATGRPVLRARSRTGTSSGAALLFGASSGSVGQPEPVSMPAAQMARYAAYAEGWRQGVAERG